MFVTQLPCWKQWQPKLIIPSTTPSFISIIESDQPQSFESGCSVSGDRSCQLQLIITCVKYSFLLFMCEQSSLDHQVHHQHPVCSFLWWKLSDSCQEKDLWTFFSQIFVSLWTILKIVSWLIPRLFEISGFFLQDIVLKWGALLGCSLTQEAHEKQNPSGSQQNTPLLNDVSKHFFFNKAFR